LNANAGRIPVMDDACKPRYGSAINRIYTRNGASKRGRRVLPPPHFVPLPHRVFPSLNIRAPRESLFKKKMETGIPVQ